MIELLGNYRYKYGSIILIIDYMVSMLFFILIELIGFLYSVIFIIGFICLWHLLWKKIISNKMGQISSEIVNEYLYWLVGFVITYDFDEITLDIPLHETSITSIMQLELIHGEIPTSMYITKVNVYQKYQYTHIFSTEYIYIVTDHPFKECYPIDSTKPVVVPIGKFLFDQEIGAISILKHIGTATDNGDVFLSIYNPYIRNQDQCQIKKIFNAKTEEK